MKALEERKLDMTWRDFERRCEELVERCFSRKDYKITFNEPRKYADGKTKRVDIRVSERKQGGRNFVIDCKHFPVATLNKEEIRTTFDYKRRSNASKAIILVSKVSNCPDSFIRSAKSQGVDVLEVSTVNASLVNQIKDYFIGRELRKRVK